MADRDYIGLCHKYFPGRIERFVKDGQTPPTGYAWCRRDGVGSFLEVPGQTVPTLAELMGKDAEWDTFVANERARTPKSRVEQDLRNNPTEMAKIARIARIEGKTVDAIIVEIAEEA